MKIEEKTILWKPVSEYTGGRVLATNGLDILVGELNPEGDCVSEDCGGTHLCGITHFAKIDGFFPELRESEDEKIRKALIDYFDDANKADENPLQSYGIHTDKAFAWLEKQGEQKPNPDWMPKFLDELRSKKNYFDWDEHKDIEGGILAIINWMNPNYFNEKDGKQKADKVEPKFKVGDWVVDNECGKVNQITSVRNKGYDFANGDYMSYESAHKELRLWDISDAKDGDVLSDGITIFIFKDLLSDGSVMSYCDYDTDSVKSDAFCPFSMNLMGQKITPTTKEQRDTLMKAMADAGYTFDFEKKELKKL